MGPCCSRNITDDIQMADQPSEKVIDSSGSSCPCPPPSTSETNIGDEAAATGGGSRNHWGTIKQLYCRTGFQLLIKRNKVKGTRKPYHKNAVLEFISVRVGEVRIKGRESGLYLAMNRKGKVYPEPDENEEGTIFVESYQNGWNTYLSRKYAHFGWYLAINKVGKVRAGHKTSFNHKSVMFLPRSAFPE